MDLQPIDYGIAAALVWTFVNIGLIIRNMLYGKQLHSNIRMSDKRYLMFSVGYMLFLSAMWSANYTFIYTHCCTSFIFLAGCVPFLLHVSEKHVTDWFNLTKALKIKI